VIRHGVAGTSDDHVHHLSHYLVHMVMACVMPYMYWLGMPITAPSPSTMSLSGPPAGAGDPILTLLLVAVLFASAVWQLDSSGRFAPQRQLALSAVGGGSGGGTSTPVESRADRRWLAPRLEVACHIAMCLTMGYMLVLMV